VLNQTFQEFEKIVVNDGSTDASVSLVDSFGNSKIKLSHQEIRRYRSERLWQSYARI
jgi:glycosyltransferase involved in cell wall biosynthesis